MTDTIFAVSSGAAPAAISVLRVSGGGAFAAVERLAGRLPDPRRAALRALRDPISDALLDRALVLVFPGPRSATGEDVVELHCHGGRATVRAIERVLAATPGCRAAEPGEFTRRALEAGRIDLTEAEGLADLLAAETEGQRRAALRAAEGGLRRTIDDWTDRTVALAAMIELAIDHEDEPDAAAEDAIVAAVQDGARVLAEEIAVLLANPPAERLRDGIRVVLAGPPNSGKSTLFNRMIGRDAAIVSPIAGTTRDRIEAPVVHGGVAWLLTDTAGLAAATDDPIESIGIVRARESVMAADIVLWLGDEAADQTAASVIALHARSDADGRTSVPEGRIAASGEMAGGDAEVWSALHAVALRLLPSLDVPALHARQRALCCAAKDMLCGASSVDDSLAIAELLRSARFRFDEITGRAGTEAVLDALFARFCIGK